MLLQFPVALRSDSRPEWEDSPTTVVEPIVLRLLVVVVLRPLVVAECLCD